MNICICGGGNLGHVTAGYIAAGGHHEVSILTRSPERWSHELHIEMPDGSMLKSNISQISAEARKIIGRADIVLLCLPGYAIRPMLSDIKPHLQPHTAVGSVVSSTGFFFQALELLPETQTLFGFQRVPYISRIVEYGQRARLMGFKERLYVAVEHGNNEEVLRKTLEDMLSTPTTLLKNHYEASLSNSNPLLHPARLYNLWSDWHEGIVYPRVPLFYEEWTEEAAQLYIDMDQELHELLKHLPVTPGSIPTVLDYYESTGIPSLARKLRSIEAFKGIEAPMKAVEGGYIPDLKSRYFTEDFAYGLSFVQQLARRYSVATPQIDRVMAWGQSL